MLLMTPIRGNEFADESPLWISACSGCSVDAHADGRDTGQIGLQIESGKSPISYASDEDYGTSKLNANCLNCKTLQDEQHHD